MHVIGHICMYTRYTYICILFKYISVYYHQYVVYIYSVCVFVEVFFFFFLKLGLIIFLSWFISVLCSPDEDGSLC